MGIDATNGDATVCTNNASRIQKWTIAPRDLSVSGGELTPTLKVKRGEVMKSYAAAIDAMYESREKFVPFVPNAAGAGSAQAEPKNCRARRKSSLWWWCRLVLACTIQYRYTYYVLL